MTQEQYLAYESRLNRIKDEEAAQREAELRLQEAKEKAIKEGRQKGLKEGREEGRKEGIRKGAEEEKEAIARRLLKKGYDSW
ncbi:hypothetical protein [Oceanobacillus caeni]|uniref:hypothetical protein n=1 Tax=Oceanobacillus caeni TaxID=405946 RepID=UPI0019584A70